MSCDRLGVDEELSDSDDEEEQRAAVEVDQSLGGSPSSLDGAAGTSDAAGPSSSCIPKDGPRDDTMPTSNTPVSVEDGKEVTEEEKKDLVDKDDEHAVGDAGQSYEV